MNKKGFEAAFSKFSFLIEKYPVEVFLLEILAITTVMDSLRIALFLILGGAVAGGLSESAKALFKEKRPEAATKRSFYRKTFRLNRRSFPSSHSAIAIFFPTFLFGTELFFPLLAIGILIAYSRIYIKSHYLTDVLAGALIGVIVGTILKIV
ncbi:MAG: phosphatase PAP2 family protein [Nanoarchaeota archaeon]|nr:phosphatase PAP2 family protein [Nanoarchaeota archaeon]